MDKDKQMNIHHHHHHHHFICS